MSDPTFDDRPIHVESYLVHAILATFFCCLPFGIVAIVNASQVSSKLAAGDYDGAARASQSAKTWSIVSAVCGLVALGAYVLLAVSGGR